MLEEWIARSSRRAGAYMKDRQFSNATAGDLWHHMEQASGKSVAAVASSWTDQKGFPVLQVAASCKGGRTTVAHSHAFQLEHIRYRRKNGKIPIVLVRGKERRVLLLDRPTANETFDGCSNVPVLANPEGLGFYRISYDSATLRTAGGLISRVCACTASGAAQRHLRARAGGACLDVVLLPTAGCHPQVEDESRSALFSLAIDHLKF